ncbi:MAG: hypothetical protein ACLQOO_01065 [Terriglobia bacterium]
MSKKNKHRNQGKPWPAPHPAEAGGTTPGAGAGDPGFAEVERLLAQGHSRPALELAKQVHKRAGTSASEVLLIKAYVARIRSLLKSGLAVEAKALLELVRQRYPSAKGALAEIGVAVATRQESLDDLLHHLNDPALAPERRAEIETTIRRQLTDLGALAQSPVLPAEHPLRASAARLQRACESVTTGPVEDDALALPEISRRSPLAPWKMLVRAIAAFYRPDDAACEHWLQLIDPDSAPARLAPALRSMISRHAAPGLKPAASFLVAQVGGKVDALRGALQSLDAAFAAGRRKQIVPAIQNAVRVCREACPDLVDRLRQHIGVYAFRADITYEQVREAMAGAPRKGAYFWRLMARQAEDPRAMACVPACTMWNEFRRHAIHEGWFPADGPEVAALYLHMADILQHVPREDLGDLQQSFRDRYSGRSYDYMDQAPSIREAARKYNEDDFYIVFPEQLYARACAIDPDPEVFMRWLEWARQGSGWKLEEEAAEAWKRALPKDSRPLLRLMELAEKRGALKKALGYLEQAEGLAALNPEVRRGRLRLLVATAIRHVEQRKAHLAERDLEELEALPQAREGDRPAFLAALRWTLCVLRSDPDGASHLLAQVASLMESRVAEAMLVSGIADFCKLHDLVTDRYYDRNIVFDGKESLAAAVARGCALGDDLGWPLTIPLAFEKQLLDELGRTPGPMDARQLRLLAEAALRLDRRHLAFAASGAGLAKGGATEARFLLLRGRALPEYEPERRDQCFAAAAELARRQRDMGLVDEAVECRRGHFFMGAFDPLAKGSSSMSADQLNKLLNREKQASEFPPFRNRKFEDPFDDEPFFDDDDEDDDDDDEEFDDDIGPVAPEEFDEIMNQLNDLLGMGKRRGPRHKYRRRPGPPGPPRPSGGPGQGSLF